MRYNDASVFVHEWPLCAIDDHLVPMNTIHPLTVTLFVCLLVPLASIAKEPQDADGLTLSLRLDKTVVAPNEPVHGSLILSNGSKQPVVLWAGIWNTASIYISKDGAKPIEILGRQNGLDIGGDIEFKPGQLMSSQERIPNYRLSVPGEYKIHAIVEVASGLSSSKEFNKFLKSNVATVTVRRPTLREQEIIRLLKDQNVQRLMGRFPAYSVEGEKILKRIIVDYAESDYPDHARFALGKSYWVLAHRKESEDFQQQQKDKGIGNAKRRRNVKLRRIAFDYFAGVSKKRNPLLYLRSLIHRGNLFLGTGLELFKDGRQKAKSIQDELQQNATQIKQLGLQEQAEEIVTDLKRLAEEQN